MGRLRPLAGVSLVGVAVACALVAGVYLTLGTRWGNEMYLFRYLVVASFIPLVAAVVTGRYHLAVPSLLLPAGIVTFVGGFAVDLACLQATANPWGIAYDVGRNVIRWGPRTERGLACTTRPGRPLVVLGYALTTTGVLQLVDAATAREWSPVDLPPEPDAD